MSQPKLTILGVYRPVISAETWKQQWEVTAEDEFTREHFDKLVLIEAIVEGLSAPFEMDKFGQMAIDHPDEPERMMVGYDEGLLTPDGESLVQREMD
jgi:hypothetical protein